MARRCVVRGCSGSTYAYGVCRGHWLGANKDQRRMLIRQSVENAKKKEKKR